MNSENKLVFYILRQKSDDTTKDFGDFIYQMRQSYQFVDVVNDTPSSVSLSGQANYKSSLVYQTTDKPEIFKDYSLCLRLEISTEDYLTFGKIRKFLARQRDVFRVYSQQLHSYLPLNPDLVSLEFGSINIQTFTILKKYGILPIYYSQDNHHYFALDVKGQIHIVNRFLLEYLYDKEIPEAAMPELSYVVAPNLDHFAAMNDKRLIPQNFYEYYQKSSKIINDSNFNIDNPGRKVFVKPYIFEFKEKLGEFYTYAGPDGASMLMMTKILKGETLEGCLKRLLIDDLKIAQDFVGAYVSKEIEFDRDKEGILTPRLVVFVYVDKIIDKPRALQMSQTGWKSVNGNLPNLTPNPEFNKVSN